MSEWKDADMTFFDYMMTSPNVKYVCRQCTTSWENRNDATGCNMWKRIDGQPNGHRFRWIAMNERPGRTPAPLWATGNEKCATPNCTIPRSWVLPSTEEVYCEDCYLRNREIHGLNAPRFTGFDDVEFAKQVKTMLRTLCGCTRESGMSFNPPLKAIHIPLPVTVRPYSSISGKVYFREFPETRRFDYYETLPDGTLVYQEAR